jgi:GGDEF domain-containing protein
MPNQTVPFRESQGETGIRQDLHALRLASIAARLRACIRSGDTASCVGGDEFVIVCAASDVSEDTAQLAARILDAVAEPILSGSRAVIE